MLGKSQPKSSLVLAAALVLMMLVAVACGPEAAPEADTANSAAPVVAPTTATGVPTAAPAEPAATAAAPIPTATYAATPARTTTETPTARPAIAPTVAHTPSPMPTTLCEPQTSCETGLIITSPADGTGVSSGDTVLVVVEPEAGVVVDSVLLLGATGEAGGPAEVVVDDSSPFEFNFPIPTEAAGAFQFFAVGKDSSGNIFGSNEIILQVTPLAALQSMTLIPRNAILVTTGESLNFSVLGSFADGIVRNITRASAGTVYLTTDPSIFTVTPSGLGTSVSAGNVTVVAQNAGLQDSVSVRVLLPNQVPIADAGPDQERDGDQEGGHRFDGAFGQVKNR